MSKQKKLIDLQKVSKEYVMGGEVLQALSAVTLEISGGEYVSILGPSGSGKSTLMNILGCLDQPSAGEYYLHGDNVAQFNRRQLAITRNQCIGFVFQRFNLLEYATALDNVALPLIYRGESAALRRQKAEAALKSVGLADRMQHRPNELSGGQRQRVAIARALVTNPDILLADEPTGNLDTQSGNEVIKLFEHLITLKKTVIVVTHNEEMAQRTERVIRLRDGKLVQ